MKNNNQNIQQILKKVKQHKKYKTLSNQLVLDEINNYLKQQQIKPTEITKQDIKNIRASLHRLYSSYQTKKQRKKQQYLEELRQLVTQNKNIDEITKNLLSITLSTKERLKDYKYIYKQIFQTTKKPKIIIDLASGLNPLSYPLMNIKPLIIYSYDIDEDDMKFLNQYYKIMKPQGLKGKAAIWNLRDLKEIPNLPSSDIVFLFKIIDLIDKKHKKISEKLITQLIKIKTKYIVASFATKTLTRKPMKLPKRKGFELMLNRNNLKFKTFSTDNEVFYVIRE